MIHPNTVIRVGGLLAGCGLALGFVALGRVEQSRAVPAATLKVAAGSADELVVEPAGDVLVARDLRPGGPASRARVRVRNPTEVTLSVRPLISARSIDLDRVVDVEVSAGDRPLFSGPLGELRRPARRALTLRRGERETIELSAAIPRSAAAAQLVPREVEAKLELATEIASR